MGRRCFFCGPPGVGSLDSYSLGSRVIAAPDASKQMVGRWQVAVSDPMP